MLRDALAVAAMLGLLFLGIVTTWVLRSDESLADSWRDGAVFAALFVGAVVVLGALQAATAPFVRSLMKPSARTSEASGERSPDETAREAVEQSLGRAVAKGAWFRLVGSGGFGVGVLAVASALLSWSASHTQARLPSHFFVTIDATALRVFDVRYPGSNRRSVRQLAEWPLRDVKLVGQRDEWEVDLLMADGRTIAMRSDHESPAAEDFLATLVAEARLRSTER